MDEELLGKIIGLVEARDDASNGKCGITPVEIKFALDVDYKLLKDHLQYLYEQNKIRVRKGVNSLLIFNV